MLEIVYVKGNESNDVTEDNSAYDPKKITSWAYNEPKYKSLLEKLNTCQTSVDYPRKDIRNFIFEKLRLVILPITSILSLLASGEKGFLSIQNQNGTEKKISNEEFAGFFRLKLTSETVTENGFTINKNMNDFTNNLSKIMLLGGISTCHFQLEVFFDLLKEPIEKEIDSKYSGRTEFYDGLNDFCSNVSSSIKDKMTVLQFTRNTMHNDGMHNNRTEFHYSIEEVKYDFINKKLSDVASWGHFYLILDEIIDIVFQIAMDEKIKSIEGPLQTEHMKKIFKNDS